MKEPAVEPGSSAPADFVLRFPVEQIEELAARFSYPRDDRECLEIGRCVRTRGHYTRDEMIAVCEWKSSRSRRWVAQNTEEDAEFITGEALSTSDEEARMATLRWLWGVDAPTASALLFFAFPDLYPIIDVRALESLGQARPRYYTEAFWLGYLEACRRISRDGGVPIRTLDKALWQASVEGLASG
jgi:hypothetical protein